MNSSFGNCDCLLFHNFMNSNSVSIIHFVKLINANHSSISKNHCSCFQMPISIFCVYSYSRCKTNTRSSSTGCVYAKWRKMHDMTKNLGFCSRRITDHKNVDISSQVSLIFKVFLVSPKHLKNNGSFNVCMALNRWSKALCKQVKYIFTLSNFSNISNVILM